MEIYEESNPTMPKETIKASVTIKAESLYTLTHALRQIMDVNIQCVTNATISTSISIESTDSDDLRDALTDIARAIAVSEGVEAKIAAPAEVWTGRAVVAGPTPMESYINKLEA